MKYVDEVFNVHTPAKDIKFKVGQIFGCKKDFKEAVRSNSMETGRPYQYAHDDLKRVQVVCAHGCPIKMWLGYDKDKDRWQIKSILNDHNCVWNHKNKLVTTKYLVEVFGDRIRKNPNWKLCDMQEEFKRVLKVDVCDAKCSRVRKAALSGVVEKMAEHYAKLRKFGGEILRSNRQNTVKISTTRLQEGDVSRFRRIYICYDALKNAWKNECRPVLGLDGCFLKTVTGGQLLSAVGRDGNNCIMPIAMAVVESENYDSWKWFLELLIADLDLEDGNRKTLISDQQKGLDKAIKELLPQVEHRFCTQHLGANLKGKYPSGAVSDAFWRASTATHPQAFKSAMKELASVSKGAFEKMNQLDPAVWSKAYFKTHSKTDSTENNISECFNSWILKARYMPLIDMLIEIHDMIMTRVHENRDRMARRDCLIVPKAKKNLDEAVKDGSAYSVLWDGRETYVVKGKGTSCSVNLKNRSCSCRIWDLTGIPCAHGVVAIQKARHDVFDYIDKCYSKETYMRCYSHCLDVIRGEDFWEDVEGDTVMPPLIVKQLRGRPKKMRRREGWEGVVSSGKKARLSFSGRKMHCGLCRKEGHKRDKCPDKHLYSEGPKKQRGRPQKE
ncbi:uncharacterized protein LOC141673496 [Apium graveolens]|uniref:uncharacterized protein LOC141673496 n=1 Tax=Apium graveolens TaxID=4045 RepID=UPI003D7A5F09